VQVTREGLGVGLAGTPADTSAGSAADPSPQPPAAAAAAAVATPAVGSASPINIAPAVGPAVDVGPMPVDTHTLSPILGALKKVMQHPAAQPFLEPVPAETPGYLDQITHPMDLSTVSHRR
jgi:hypothetical protein